MNVENDGNLKTKQQKKDLRALVDGKMDDYGVTKKTVYSVLGLLGCLFLVIVLSITGANFDPAVFLTWDYWVMLIIDYAIAIFSMITGRQMGDDMNRNSPEKQYRRELRNYSIQYKRIEDGRMEAHFPTWLGIRRDKKRVDKIHDILKDWHIFQFEVLDLDVSELGNLKNPYKKEWKGTPYYEKYLHEELNPDTNEKETVSRTYFKTMSKDQIEVIKAILEGKITVSDVSSSYFLNALKGMSTDEWERAAKAEKKKSTFLTSGYMYRLISMFALSIVLNGIAPSPYGSSASTIWLNIARRVFVMVMSTTWGIYLGMKVVDMDCVFLCFKTLILTEYANDVDSGEFKFKTEEEIAKEQYERKRAEDKKAAEAVVPLKAEPLRLSETPSSVIIPERR